MYLGQRLIIKHENKIIEGNIEKIGYEDLDIKLDDGTILQRKYWEVRKIDEKKL